MEWKFSFRKTKQTWETHLHQTIFHRRLLIRESWRIKFVVKSRKGKKNTKKVKSSEALQEFPPLLLTSLLLTSWFHVWWVVDESAKSAIRSHQIFAEHTQHMLWCCWYVIFLFILMRQNSEKCKHDLSICHVWLTSWRAGKKSKEKVWKEGRRDHYFTI